MVVRFSLRMMFCSLSLICLGLGLLVSLFRVHSVDWHGWSALAFASLISGLWLGGGAAIGAGVFVPFRKKKIGIILGVLIQVLIAMFYIFLTPIEP